jgi:hypothetical protein
MSRRIVITLPPDIDMKLSVYASMASISRPKAIERIVEDALLDIEVSLATTAETQNQTERSDDNG